MPLKSHIKVDTYTQVLVWSVTESNEELLQELNLSQSRIKKYVTLSEKRKREFLGLLLCLKHLHIDIEVLYDDKGKPYLDSSNHISITHSHGIVAVALSRYKIGIDIELEREKKIKAIERKFIRNDEQFVNEKSEKSNTFLHIIWGIKESLYKLDGGKFWSFLKHYRVERFHLKDKFINCWITKETVSDKYYAFWRKIDNYFLVIVMDYD